jgi:hypothetical protein
MDMVQPLDVGDTIPARHDQAHGRAVILGQRIAVHLPGDDDLVTHRVIDVHAAREILFDIGVADILGALVGTVKDDLDTGIPDPGAVEQVTQPNATPFRVADEAVIEILPVAPALEAGIYFELVHAPEFVQR